MDIFDAVDTGIAERVRERIEAGVDVNGKDSTGWTVLMDVTRHGHTEIAKILIEAGADVNAKDDSEWTALMNVACSVHTETAKMLIEADADVNVKDSIGWTALMSAVRHGRTEMVKMLVQAGADVNSIPVGHALYKKYYFYKAHDHMDDFGVRIDCLLKAEEYDVVSRIVAEKCGLPFGETPEIRSVADFANFICR